MLPIWKRCDISQTGIAAQYVSRSFLQAQVRDLMCDEVITRQRRP